MGIATVICVSSNCQLSFFMYLASRAIRLNKDTIGTVLIVLKRTVTVLAILSQLSRLYYNYEIMASNKNVGYTESR